MAVISRGQITLTDLTDQRPARMDLKTSLSIIQKEFNGKFEPNYIASGTSIGEVPESGQIITPTVYFGNEEVSYEKYYFSIIYNCSDTGDNVDYKYDPDNEIPQDGSTFVDRYGRLHFNRNLTQTTVIEVEIPELIDEATGVLYSSISEEISLSKVDYKSGYGAYIESVDGRYDFKKEGAKPIELEAKLFYGTEQISAKSYQWYTSIDDENAIFTGNIYTVKRSNVHGHETFICKMTTEEDMVFQAQIGIEDRLDDFYSEIIVSKGILTPIENTAQLSVQVFEKGQVYSHPEDIEIIYDWYYSIGKDFNDFTGDNDNFDIINIKLDQTENIPTKDEKGIFHFPKKDLTFYCKTSIYRIPTASNKIEEKTLIGVANTYVPIRYSPNTIVSLNPENIFIPAKEDGSFNGGDDFTQTIVFKITDDAGIPIDYENVGNDLDPSDIGITGLTGTEEDDKNPFSFSVKDVEEGKWIKEITITLADAEKFKKLENTTSFTINYTRLGYDFSKDFYIIKNIQGIQGVSGYGFTLTLDNDYHKFAGGETAARAEEETEFTFKAFLAEEELRINSVNIGNTTLSPGEENWNIIEGLGITLTTAEDNFSATISLKTGNGEDGKPFLTEGGKISIIAKVVRENGEDFDFIKSFQYDINFNGDSYSLKCEPANVVYSPATSSFDAEQIIINAQKREGGIGPNIEYKQGYVYYFIDDSKVGNQLTSTSGTYILNLTSANGITEKTKRVIFKLYSSQYDPDNPDEGYMMDQETISFITSSDGITIGGTNLLRWTKELPVESGKWSREGNFSEISITTDTDEFSILTFNVDGTETSDTWYGFHSPKIAFSEDFLNKTFCFSCLYKKEDISEISGLVSVQCHSSLTAPRIGRKDFNLTKKYFMEEKNNTWVKLFFNFEIKEDFFKTFSGTVVDINTITHLSIGFWARGNSKKFSIKKPKLELGTQPTDWSASPYDIDYNSIAGTNLGKGSYSLEVKTSDNPPYNVFALELESNTYYTFSFKNSFFEKVNSTDTQFICELRSYDKGKDDSDSVSEATYKFSNSVENTLTIETFQTPNNSNKFYSFRIYPKSTISNTSVSTENTETLTLLQAKLEEGQEATSFFISEQYIQNIINTLSNNSSENAKTITFLQANGEKIVTELENLEETISVLEGSTAVLDDLTGTIQSETNKILSSFMDEGGDGNYLNVLKNYVDIVTNDDEPYIQLGQKTGVWENKLKLTQARLSFMESTGTNEVEVAYISSQKLFINQAHFNQTFSIGELLVKITESGVGFTWTNTNTEA